jgi:hypothetical protein
VTWIKFHRPDGEAVWINAENVHIVTKDRELTLIGFSGPSSALYVKETVEEAMDRLRRLSV